MSKEATIETVAKEAGVSVGTVSRYLNGYKIRSYNQEAIEQAIEQLDFKINQQARGLKLQRSFTIALLFPNISDVFATQVIQGVEEICDQNNYSVVICSAKDDLEVEKERIQFINDKRVDGAILMPISDKSLDAFKAVSEDIPYVVIDKKIKDLEADYVICDNKTGSKEGVNKLIDAGHRDIAVIGGPRDVFTAVERMDGYHQAMTESNLPTIGDYITRGKYEKNGGLKSIEILMNLPEPPTAIFATNFEITMSVIKYCMEHGIKIGQELSILGYDNIDVFEMLTPSIAAVEQPMKEIGIASAIRLFEKIDKKEDEFKTKILNTKVVNGTSIYIFK